MGSCPDTDIDPKRPGFNENGYIFFHLHLLDTRLIIANSVLRALLAIYHLISDVRSWINS